MASGGRDRAGLTVNSTLNKIGVGLNKDISGASTFASMDNKVEGHVFHLNLTIQFMERNILNSICSNSRTFITIHWQV